jgi:hypothetical protein
MNSFIVWLASTGTFALSFVLFTGIPTLLIPALSIKANLSIGFVLGVMSTYLFDKRFSGPSLRRAAASRIHKSLWTVREIQAAFE